MKESGIEEVVLFFLIEGAREDSKCFSRVSLELCVIIITK
jgi:hypothetical protein